jgi:hypothetical protein
VFLRSLTDAIKTVNYRIRISPEYAYYEDYAWSQARTAAAKALNAKLDERALLLYQGEPDWKYRQNLKKRDNEIIKLREAFEQKEAEKPNINREPAFMLTQANRDGNFPPAPNEGGEYRFCQSQKADAFLTGAIQDFYGRYYVTLRLYVLYTRSFIYESDIVFSADDIEDAVAEIAGRLTAVLAGSKPAAIAIRAEPEDTLILINQSFAGRGTVEPREMPQGKKTVVFSLDGYKPQTVETELFEGELTEINVSLSPLEYADMNITVPGKTGVSVYQGALYAGEAPLTLRLPLDQLDYITVTAEGGERAEAVHYTPMYPDESRTLSLRVKIPPPQGQKRVNRARRQYYWAWGGTWISGIAAWISYGIYTEQSAAFSQGQMSGIANQNFYDDTVRMYYVSMGAIILTGAAVAYEVFRMARYLYTATEAAVPVVKTGMDK